MNVVKLLLEHGARKEGAAQRARDGNHDNIAEFIDNYWFE